MSKRANADSSSELSAVRRAGSVASTPAPAAAAAPLVAAGKSLLPPPLTEPEPLARGGFGVVLRAKDATLLRSVAVKVFDPPKPNPESTLRFREEAQITGQLEHPNLGPVYQLGDTSGGRPFFGMKLVQGETLLDLLRAQPPESLSSQHLYRVLQIFLRICDAMAFAHGKGVLHRDLKPENVMVGEHGQVYLMDWGLAQLFNPTGTTDGRVHLNRERKIAAGVSGVAGTVSYMSPEQAHGLNAQLDVRTDVFGLGAILYQALSGRPPHRGKTALEKLEKAKKCEIEHPSEAAPSRILPGRLCQIAMKALAAHPNDRYPTVEALRDDVVRFLQGGGWFSSRTFAPGELIVSEAEHADAAYIITGGICEVFRMDHGRKEWLRTLGPGDVFGETAIFAAEPRTATVQAVTTVTAIQVTRDSLEQELGLQSWVGAFVKALAVRFRELDREVVALRHARDDADLVTRALMHIALHGKDVRGGREVKWKPLLTELMASGPRPESDFSEALGRSPRLLVEPSRDRVLLRAQM